MNPKTADDLAMIGTLALLAVAQYARKTTRKDNDQL